MSARVFNALMRGLVVAVAVVIAIRIGGGFWREALTSLAIILLSFASVRLLRKMWR